MTQNQIVNGFDLNGLPISLRGATAYKGVSLMSCWQFGDVKQYVALVGLNEDERRISGKSTFIFHLSAHDNPLDAAWVAMKFHEDKATNLLKLRDTRTCEWDHGPIPKFEFEPIGHVEKVTGVVGMKKVKAAVAIDNRSADSNFDVLYSKYNIPALLAKFGRDTVLTARKLLTINEFELRFGLESWQSLSAANALESTISRLGR
jgi:hypothetical protein